MSRKNNKLKQQQLPVDTGGLDLTPPPQTLSPADEPAIDVLAAPSNAHKAVEELETLPPAQSLQGNVQPVGLPYFIEPGDCDDCLRMMEAIHMTPLYMAVRKTNVKGALVLCNGSRYWTVAADTFEPCLFDGVAVIDGLREAYVWRPVLGNEKGWYVG